ncbi:Asp-tRNA(Asn)/Glu-tRNA(Gln) amidotransferase subunit GatC [Hoyosella sp. G463]|uniref:Aspartyl/glutamyl-tRNA(Asn/Gln) amidotransferase subunit C n=1 Tax=Lolliginicoccus lacisalsi TaxID=2742202 RepID=A0A927JDW6_9ACTN|nr:MULTISPECIES: Asp-tRNA(Asn)/Glu-tRNA(Gln) amidotransferase subunit GatC [Lolliginicoccus]MBD8507548.1 Asp-tRNA(Asn)/Glu-tRNA(Gln) amidotransferase subunit GatC [Lolliginicoccus lacisalsi]
MPAISRDEVAHLARLSRLALSDAELDEFAGQLDAILGHVKAVTEVAADDVPATAHPAATANVWREDVIEPGLTVQQALSGAPEADGDRFAVPQILGEEQ